MATLYNTSIVRDGLVLHLDAANPKSYPGTGTVWTDLSGNGNNGTLVNGVGYSVDNKGLLTFDGIDDYGQTTDTNITDFQPSQAFSVFVWVYDLTFDGGAILSNMDHSGSGIPGWDLWLNDSSKIAMHLIASWSSNAIKVGIDYDYKPNIWRYIGYTYNGSTPTTSVDSLNSVDWYINGQLTTDGKTILSSADGFNSATTTIPYTSRQSLRICSRWPSTGTSPYSNITLTLSNIQIYNRALTAEEIQQNFEALRGRFGI